MWKCVQLARLFFCFSNPTVNFPQVQLLLLQFVRKYFGYTLMLWRNIRHLLPLINGCFDTCLFLSGYKMKRLKESQDVVINVIGECRGARRDLNLATAG